MASATNCSRRQSGEDRWLCSCKAVRRSRTYSNCCLYLLCFIIFIFFSVCLSISFCSYPCISSLFLLYLLLLFSAFSLIPFLSFFVSYLSPYFSLIASPSVAQFLLLFTSLAPPNLLFILCLSLLFCVLLPRVFLCF